MAAMPMLAGVGLMMVCCSSSSLASLMMGGDGDDSAADTGAGAGAGAEADYTESCDDLGGGVLVRHEADVDLDSCKTYCSNDSDCLGFVHTAATGFCQLHDNKKRCLCQC